MSRCLVTILLAASPIFCVAHQTDAVTGDPRISVNEDFTAFSNDVSGLNLEDIHPGYEAILNTVNRHNRHHKNVYIIFAGGVGSGKSEFLTSAVEALSSSTVRNSSDNSKIVEYTIPVLSSSLYLKGTTLKFIDIPEFLLNTDETVEANLEKILNLEKFLSTHQDLQFVQPNMILLFASIDEGRDARFGGVSALLHLLSLSAGAHVVDRHLTNLMFLGTTTQRSLPMTDSKFKQSLRRDVILLKSHTLVVKSYDSASMESGRRMVFTKVQNLLLSQRDDFGWRILQAFLSSGGQSSPIRAQGFHASTTKAGSSNEKAVLANLDNIQTLLRVIQLQNHRHGIDIDDLKRDAKTGKREQNVEADQVLFGVELLKEIRAENNKICEVPNSVSESVLEAIQTLRSDIHVGNRNLIRELENQFQSKCFDHTNNFKLSKQQLGNVSFLLDYRKDIRRFSEKISSALQLFVNESGVISEHPGGNTKESKTYDQVEGDGKSALNNGQRAQICANDGEPTLVMLQLSKDMLHLLDIVKAGEKYETELFMSYLTSADPDARFEAVEQLEEVCEIYRAEPKRIEDAFISSGRLARKH